MILDLIKYIKSDFNTFVNLLLLSAFIALFWYFGEAEILLGEALKFWALADVLASERALFRIWSS